MKKLALVLCFAVLVSMLAACGTAGTKPSESSAASSASSEAEDSSTESGSDEMDVGVPNPYHAATAEDFAALGITLQEPEGAEDVVYNTIDTEPVLAQIDFTLDGVPYTLRAGKTTEDISGVYLEWNPETISVNADYADKSLEITIKTNEEGGRLATWNWDDTTFSLFTVEGVSDDVMTNLATALAEASYPQ